MQPEHRPTKYLTGGLNELQEALKLGYRTRSS